MATKISELAAVAALANPDELELVDKDDVTHGPAGTSKKCTVQQIRQTADDHIADATGAHAATAISNAPAGGIAATTVQAAIDELDTEKLAATHEGAGGAVHADVVAGGADGFMTGADKTKLDGIAAGAQVNDPDTVLSSPINLEVQVSQVIGITQAAYDALTPDANTLYLITGP